MTMTIIKAALLTGMLLTGFPAKAQENATSAATEAKRPSADTSLPEQGALFQARSVDSEGAVTVEGKRIAYHAVAGTLIVHPEGWDDAAWREKGTAPGVAALGDKANPQAEAAMFYTAYFAKGAAASQRPITFIYNGGPGSATVWLHMGAWGPRRVVTSGDQHLPGAPYNVIDNNYSLLDASDLVFIDAPGAGFSRVAGKDKEKAFFGVDADGHAFTQFIIAFLNKYGRWNSPKYLFGESYGTPRSAVVINELETGNSIDFNGVILLSQILNFNLSIDGPESRPGSDEAYVVALPTMAATAWYHNRVSGSRPPALEPFLKEAEAFAIGDYASALMEGSEIDPARKRAVAERLSHYIGLPIDYLLRANLRIGGGTFSKQLQGEAGITTGRLDTRFSGPNLDPLSRDADYDPQSASISSAYVSAFNDYARKTLHYGSDEAFKPSIRVIQSWSFAHKQPGGAFSFPGATNVMPDLANAMKVNPKLKVLLTGGYYDLATPYFEGWFEMHHLPIPDSLQANISYKYYPSGHMVYAVEEQLRALHDDSAQFIRENSRGR